MGSVDTWPEGKHRDALLTQQQSEEPTFQSANTPPVAAFEVPFFCSGLKMSERASLQDAEQDDIM